ncbi:MAG: hypothetical protein V8Q42_09880 [Anaerovoracaceae bacterium]
MGIPKAADEYETSDDDPVVAEQMNLHFMERKISYVTEYYDGLYESERDIELYKEKDEFERKAIKLKKRIARELKRKKYISDIKISDEEYDLLMAYLHYAAPIIQKGVLSRIKTCSLLRSYMQPLGHIRTVISGQTFMKKYESNQNYNIELQLVVHFILYLKSAT